MKQNSSGIITAKFCFATKLKNKIYITNVNIYLNVFIIVSHKVSINFCLYHAINIEKKNCKL